MSTNDELNAGQGATGSGPWDPAAAAGTGRADAAPEGSAGSPSPYVAMNASTEAWPTRASASPYTSVPQAPAGYSFDRAPAAAPGGGADPRAAGAPGSQNLPPHSVTGAPSAPGAAPAAPAAAGAAGAAAGPAAGAPQTTEPRSSTRRGPGWGGVVATSLATAMLACGGTVAAVHYLDVTPDTGAMSSSQHTGGTTQAVTQTGSSPDWETVTQAVANSVVSITVATASGTAVGSGVVYDAAGHIVTNHHVVAGATTIQVTLADGRIYDAELTGSDAATDLAVVQLVNAPKDLTVARFGDSESVVTGQDVMAIGNPLGLSSTVTTGIVSALDRPVVTTQEETDSSQAPGGGLDPDAPSASTTSQVVTSAIQIDAAVNPGNSGGPLFDETGAVIGITSSIASRGSESEAGSIGIGFAIPSNLTTKVADQLIATGTATHAYLGVTVSNGEARTEEATYAGALVGDVESGSPAQEAGLKPGDVITAINGKATSQSAALTGFVRQYSAGDTVALTVVRDGKTLELTATLAERKDS